MDPQIYKAVTLGTGKHIISSLDPNCAHITCGRSGNTILHLAAQSGNKNTAEYILNSCPSLAFGTNLKGDTPLHTAARLGRLEVAMLLTNYAQRHEVLEAGMNPVRVGNMEKNTALHEAARNGHFDVVRLLIAKDGHLSSLVNTAGESPLFLAVDRGYHKIAHFILETFPSCLFSGRNGMTVMHAAVIRNQDCKFSYLFRSILYICCLFTNNSL